MRAGRGKSWVPVRLQQHRWQLKLGAPWEVLPVVWPVLASLLWRRRGLTQN